MEPEVVEYRGKAYRRYPQSERRQLRVYYWHHGEWKEPPVALHRQLWLDNNGPIPAGMVVHHKDGNPFNNEFGNLELVPKRAHSALHAGAGMRAASSERLKRRWASGKMASELSSYWGSARQREHGKRNAQFLRNAPKREHVCEICGKAFLSTRVQKVRWCGEDCYAEYLRISGKSKEYCARYRAKRARLQPASGGDARVLRQ